MVRITPMVDCVCQNLTCGRIFQLPARQVRQGRGKHCCRSCASATNARRNHEKYPRLGERNPNFKGWRSRDKSAYKDAFRARYPEKALAHDAVVWALRTGRLVRPDTCQRCGVRATEPLHSHHEDYEKPLIVVFVCRPCHRELDTNRNRRLQGTRQIVVVQHHVEGCAE